MSTTGFQTKSAFERSLKTLASSLVLRAERRDDYVASYVDFGHLERLRTADWQIVFGRRGVGKTHLFGALSEFGWENRRRTGEIWITVDGLQILQMTPVRAHQSDQARSNRLFRNFLKLVAMSMIESTDRVWRDSDRKVHTLSDRVKSRLADIALEMSIEAERPRAIDDVRQLAARVSRYLSSYLEVSGSSRLFILIDEFAALDEASTSMVQPLFADLLKHSLRGTPSITVKLASPRLQTNLSNRGDRSNYVGLEMGADIFEGVNLDRVNIHFDEQVRLYRELLFRRLEAVEPTLSVYRVSATQELNENFVEVMFSSHDAFAELVRGAEGNPRRFFLAILELATRSNYRLDRPWNVRDVHTAVRQAAKDDEDELEYNSPEYELLWGPVVDTVLSSGQRRFYASRFLRSDFRDSLDELLQRRVIHERPPGAVPIEARRQYDAYVVDYAIWLELESALRSRGGRRRSEPDWTSQVVVLPTEEPEPTSSPLR